jgi:hypothetical protein
VTLCVCVCVCVCVLVCVCVAQAEWLTVLCQMLRKAALKLVDSPDAPWDSDFVYGTMENRLSATTVVRVFMHRGAPVVSCLAGISKYLKFDFDSADADGVNAYAMNGAVKVPLQFTKLLTALEVSAEVEAQRAADQLS